MLALACLSCSLCIKHNRFNFFSIVAIFSRPLTLQCWSERLLHRRARLYDGLGRGAGGGRRRRPPLAGGMAADGRGAQQRGHVPRADPRPDPRGQPRCSLPATTDTSMAPTSTLSIWQQIKMKKMKKASMQFL